MSTKRTWTHEERDTYGEVQQRLAAANSALAEANYKLTVAHAKREEALKQVQTLSRRLRYLEALYSQRAKGA